MTDRQTRHIQIKYTLITIATICTLLAPFIFAKTQRNHSLIIYEESLAALHTSGFPNDASAYIASEMATRPAIDFLRQDRFWDLLKSAENWSELGSYLHFKTEKPLTLNSKQHAWLDDSLHKKDTEKLLSLLTEGHLDKNMLAWLAQRYPKPQDFDFIKIYANVTPSLMAVRNYSKYLQLRLIRDGSPQNILEWRTLNTHSSSLIGCMINAAVLTEIDTALAYHTWRQASPEIRLDIIEAKDAFKQCLTGELLFFGESFAKGLNEHDWLDLHLYTQRGGIIENTPIYMWGLLDCAEYIKYHMSLFAALDNTSLTPVKDIPIEIHTYLGNTFLPNIVESFYTLYSSNSHQRLCQLSIDLSNYYHQHKQLPENSSALKKTITNNPRPTCR